MNPPLGWLLARITLCMALVALLVPTVRSQAQAVPRPAAAVPESPGLYAIFHTSLGDFVCRLEFEKAPVTVGNFVALAEGKQAFLNPRTGEWVKARFYDGQIFHRVLKGFIVQGGDPLGDGTGGPGYEFIDEFHPSLRHDRPGRLSMANLGPSTNGSQFFVTLKAAPHLDDRNTIFGEVVSGMSTIESMCRQPTMGPARSTPITDIRLESVRIVRKGKAAQDFDALKAFALQEKIIAERMEQRRKEEKGFRQQLEENLPKYETTETGLQYLVLASGDGKRAKPGDAVKAHYVGYLQDGRLFDSSYERDEPFRFRIGTGSVIQGWDEAFSMMRVGEKRRIIMPPKLGYGSRGLRRFGIPPNATLIFDLELIEVAPE